MYGFRLILICKVISCSFLFESFFNVMCIFGSVELQIECNLQFWYNIIFQRYQSFESSSSTLRGNRYMRSRAFLYEIQF